MKLFVPTKKRKSSSEEFARYDKEYIVMTKEAIPYMKRGTIYEYDLAINVNEMLYFMNEQEIKNYVEQFGRDNILYISKNNKVEIETIVNIKEMK